MDFRGVLHAQSLALIQDAINFSDSAAAFANNAAKPSPNKKPQVTLLHQAVKSGDYHSVRHLLQTKSSVTTFDFDGNTPLHLAFIFKHTMLVDLILNSIERTSTFVNCINKQNLSHLHIAATRKNVKIIEGLLTNGADLTHRVDDDSLIWSGYTALHFAVEFESLEAAKVLLDASKKSEFKSVDGKDRTPLQLLYKKMDEMMILAHLLEKKDSEGVHANLSFFEVACMRGEPKLVKRFIEFGADVDDKNELMSNYSPMHFAVQNRRPDNAEVLLERGADVNHTDSRGMTALHLALYNEDTQLVDKLYAAVEDKLDDRVDDNGLSYFHVAVIKNDFETVKTYLDGGFNVNNRVERNSHNFSNFTPLHMATRYENVEMVKLLIQRGANVNANDEGEFGTPLHVACGSGNIETIELLLNNNADVKIRTGELQTPLHLLAERYRTDETSSRADLVKYVHRIVKIGCEVNARDEDGDTALHLLRWETDDSMLFVRSLLQLGADVNVVNDDGELPFDRKFYKKERRSCREYVLFFHHVLNLKALGWKVDPRNEQSCINMLDGENSESVQAFSDEYLDRERRMRFDEIKRMKETALDDGVSLRDFMLLDEKIAAAYANNDVLMKFVKDEKFRKSFSVYGYLIQIQRQKALKASQVL